MLKAKRTLNITWLEGGKKKSFKLEVSLEDSNKEIRTLLLEAAPLALIKGTEFPPEQLYLGSCSGQGTCSECTCSDEDQFGFDEVPDDAGHFVAVDFYNRIIYFNFCHIYILWDN